MATAANNGENQLVVMKLEEGLHYTDDSGEDIMSSAEHRLVKRVKLLGLSSRTIHNGAWKVAEYLLSQGLKIEIKAEHHSDKDQDRYWTTVSLYACW